MTGAGGRRCLPSLLAAVALTACTGTEPASPPVSQATVTATPRTSAPTATPEPSPSAAPWTAPDRFTALWPETAASEVPAKLPAWRRSAEQTVRRFAMTVFQWDDPQVDLVETRHHTQGSTDVFTVTRATGTPAIEVHARRMVDADHWSVTYLWGFGDREPAAGVSITSEEAAVTFGYWDDAASAQLLLRYGSDRIERTSTEEASWRVPVPFPLDVTGAVMVLFRDAEGHVYTGWGTALPAGGFQAG